MGNPTEAALLFLAEKLGKQEGHSFDYKKTPQGWADLLTKTVKRVATLDFSSQRKTMSTIVSGYNGIGTNVVLLKGAAERVVQMCSGISKADGTC